MSTILPYINTTVLFLVLVFVVINFKKLRRVFGALVVLFLFPFVLIQSSSIENPNSKLRTAVVLGAGITKNNKPTLVLQTRLNIALQLYRGNRIDKIIVSGDNSTQFHNEPKVMKQYLVENGINEKIIIEDFGGRRTMDSCYRVKNFFKIDEAIVISQKFHLGRAKVLCESVGLSTDLIYAPNPRDDVTIWGYLREIPASFGVVRDLIYFRPQVGSDGSESFFEIQ
jgi:vancomycin permeability regulator SanA